MICEKCQTKEANAHLTHKFPLGPEHREPSVAFQLHLCEECAAAFKLEYDQFLQGQTPRVTKEMSKQERWEATQPLREELQKYIRGWVSRNEPQ